MLSLNRTSFVLALVAALLGMFTATASAQVKFAGVPIEGKNVTFVCDGSRWQKNKIDDLVIHLTATVQALAADQHVAVIFFADDKAFGPADGKPLPATNENKDAIRDWLEAIELGRESTPIAGFARAFEGNKPDAVVFISDGGFDDRDEVAERVDALNRDRKAKVYALGFFASESEDKSASFASFMRKLAREHGGRFKMIYADELRKPS